MIRRSGAALLPLAGLLALAIAGTAAAQTADLDVRIREVTFDQDGKTNVTVSLSGPALTGAIDAGDVVLTENGTRVGDLEVEPLTGAARGIAVALVLDTSGSTRGAALASAKGAAKNFVEQLPSSVRIALLSFGARVTLQQDFTTDKAAITSKIDGLQAATRTALYDAVVEAADVLRRSPNTQHNMVVFSDGNDTVSRASLADAVAATKDAEAPITTVLLSTRGIDERALRTLAGAQEGGRHLAVADTGALTDAFARVAQSISSQYVLSYRGTATEPPQLNLSVSVSTGGSSASDAGAFFNDRKAVVVNPPEPSKPLIPALGGAIGLWVGLATAFLAAALFVGMLIWRPAGRQAERMLARGLRLYSRSERTKERAKTEREGGMFSGSAMGRRAVELAEKVPRSKQFEEKMQKQLDQAGWPMRSSEFMVIQAGGAVVGALLGFILLNRAWLGLVLMVLGAVVPQLLLSQRMSKRGSDFLSQLPDTLQLLSGSLQAGYGFLQAIDTVAREAAPPTSTEFSRVLTEARLGMPLEDALDGMAERVGGEDFKWVVLAINIQRQVGGNLATLLQTIANTLREREQVRRQIKVLSAEGRLSAVILVVLPFALAGYISLVNPAYMSELTGSSLGRILIGVALVLIGIGIVWMRKIIKIDV